MNKAELDPWRIICGCLFEISSYDISEIIGRTAIVVEWSLNEKQEFSQSTRKAAYLPRINAAYDALSEEDKLRVVYIVASELRQRKLEVKLNDRLSRIGWRIESGRLLPARGDVKELFFPINSQHDAYVEIKKIVQKSKRSIIIIDPYLDGSIFAILSTISCPISVQLLTFRIPKDFNLEAKKFITQHIGFNLEVRCSVEFHDRFIIVDDNEFWHVGCSIKDAGNKAFMLSQLEDKRNRDALMGQQKDSWLNATPIVL